MLTVENLHIALRREPVLRGVTFRVACGTALGVCGGNGAGKSTLLSVLATIWKPDVGRVTLMDVPLGATPEYRRLIGYVPQSIALAPRLTVRQNLEFWAVLHGLSGKALHRAVDQAAGLAHVRDILNKPVIRCSGGMARRANLAAGLVGQPRLLLLDEPTAGLDAENREAILSTVTELRDEGAIVLIVNHYAQELVQVCDRIVTLRGGIIAETAAT